MRIDEALRGWVMSLDERLTWFLLGVIVGLLIGWLKDLRRGEVEIKEELEEVVKIVKTRKRDDTGFMRFPLIADAMLLAVIFMTVWASFASQKAANESEANSKQLAEVVHTLEDTQNQLAAVTACNTVYQQKTIKALNERTTYTAEQARKNVQLQQAQRQFLEIALIIPPVTKAELRDALEAYFTSLRDFVDVSQKAKQKTDKYAYPTNEELSTCITRAVEIAASKEKKTNE